MTPQWFKTARLAWEHRRPRQRITRYFECTWESPWGVQRSRVSSLSPTGCYIEDRFTVPAQGEVLRDLTVVLPGGQINLQGTVLDAMPGVGFAVRFTRVDTFTRECLTAVVERHTQLMSPR
jgi:hypothetical protein